MFNEVHIKESKDGFRFFSPNVCKQNLLGLMNVNFIQILKEYCFTVMTQFEVRSAKWLIVKLSLI